MRSAHRWAIPIVACLAWSTGPAFGQTADAPKSDDGPETVWTLDGLWATRERPLFDASRRPPVPPAPLVISRPAPPPPQPLAPASRPPPTWVLTGIVIAGDKAYAIVAERAGAPPKTVKVGDDFGGWRVDQIAPRQVVLTAGADRVVLELKSRAQAGPAGSLPVRQPVSPSPASDD